MLSDSIIHCQSTCRHCRFHGNTEGKIKTVPLLSAKLLSALSAYAIYSFNFINLFFTHHFSQRKKGQPGCGWNMMRVFLPTVSKKLHSFMIFHESGLVT